VGIADGVDEEKADAGQDMCFSALSFLAPCEVCGRCHPGEPVERCLELRAEIEAAGLDAELESYLGSAEARFFSWLAAARPRP